MTRNVTLEQITKFKTMVNNIIILKIYIAAHIYRLYTTLWICLVKHDELPSFFFFFCYSITIHKLTSTFYKIVQHSFVQTAEEEVKKKTSKIDELILYRYI